MISTQVYGQKLDEVFGQADIIARALAKCGSFEFIEVLSFMRLFGFLATPVKQNEFTVRNWLCRKDVPQTHMDGLAIIPCLSSDIPPTPPRKSQRHVHAGTFFRSTQMIILYDFDLWTPFELATTLLHEGRHARHRLGPTFTTLGPLDSNEEVHEVNCWLSMLNGIEAAGGNNWREACAKEYRAIEHFELGQPEATAFPFLESGLYWAELDHVFGPRIHPQAEEIRKALVSLRANMIYWPKRIQIGPEQTVASIVASFQGQSDSSES